MDIYTEIEQLAKTFCAEEQEKLPKICVAAAQNLQAQLRRDVSVDDCRDSFVFACALMAVSVVKTVGNETISGFDAGTLKLTFADRTDQLALMAKEIIAPWCDANQFAFRGVGA